MNGATNPDRSGASPGSGGIPRGIEVLVKKASVDDEFRQHLLQERAEAAARIGLELDPAEVMMLNGVPRGQLETIIANTRLRPAQRKLFMGRAAAVMLVAPGAVATVGCDQPVTRGIRPEAPVWNWESHSRSAENIVEEMKLLNAEAGVDLFLFQMVSFRMMGARILPSLLSLLPQTEVYREWSGKATLEFCPYLLIALSG